MKAEADSRFVGTELGTVFSSEEVSLANEFLDLMSRSSFPASDEILTGYQPDAEARFKWGKPYFKTFEPIVIFRSVGYCIGGYGRMSPRDRPIPIFLCKDRSLRIQLAGNLPDFPSNSSTHWRALGLPLECESHPGGMLGPLLDDLPISDLAKPRRPTIGRIMESLHSNGYGDDGDSLTSINYKLESVPLRALLRRIAVDALAG